MCMSGGYVDSSVLEIGRILCSGRRAEVASTAQRPPDLHIPQAGSHRPVTEAADSSANFHWTTFLSSRRSTAICGYLTFIRQPSFVGPLPSSSSIPGLPNLSEFCPLRAYKYLGVLQ
ncbi:hypothetical protein KP509_13G020500 [Ceratopteris richardii]|uniref:Uncharacterized protein n=1 Tax=Ceratopteris richardii TaxID=49495 RepID=A0A8T2TC09_CERRI|nr:hypothetical protein KP509_13G020500 [Ceratopteris richardii]KAH7420748.1 hypothetical protein KP509_13G020500 [Ceratopteris richardii]KAH7420749.1 hypothetical protein KP509_13G020500 [Ceratopteris richardii]KAH7420750.1 hypothetical protein KP509_13G020500 [Ceratopteris richardii]